MPDVRAETGATGKDELLHVHSARDIAPFANGRATALLFKVEGGSLKIVGVIDGDTRKWQGKYPSPRVATPGGLLKDYGKEAGGVEEYIVAAVQESFEEAGAVVSEENMYPLCRITKENSPFRNAKTDTEMGQRHTVEFCVFAHAGDVELRETDDNDAKHPRWCDVFSEVLSPESAWYPQHVAIVLSSLPCLKNALSEYLRGTVMIPRDVAFFEKLARTDEARESVEKGYEVEEYRKKLLEQLDSVNPIEVLEGLYSNLFAAPNTWKSDDEKKEKVARAKASARKFWNNFRAYPLGSAQYFE